MDHPPTEKPVSGKKRERAIGHGHNGAPGPHPCPECMQPFPPNHPHQLFCCDAHRQAWRARDTKRGRQAIALDMVCRITRDGTRGTHEERALGKIAGVERRRMLQEWRDEDRKAGRMPWPDYLKRRIAVGAGPVT